jgi:type IV pilus assembly protein PilC
MPLYSYKAKDNKGKIVEDVLQAANRTDAASSIKADDMQVLTIKNLDKGISSIAFGGISIAEKATFCRFLATMLRAGLPLPEAIDILKDETKNKKFRKIILDVSFQIRKGKSFSSILSKYKNDFDPVFLAMVKAGEESGSMDQSFDYLSKQLLTAHELIQKVKGAMMYPLVIVAAMLANFVVMLIFVLPKISEVFTELNVEMPTATRIMLKFGNFVGDNQFMVLGVMLIVVSIIALIFIIRKTRKIISDMFIKAPLVKNIVNQLDVARFARTLSTLLKSGVPIIVALDVSSDMIRQPGLKKVSKEFGKGVSEGESLSEVLERDKKNTFPTTVTQTIKAGEKSGSLEIVLEELADFYEREIDYSLKRLTSLLEPLLLLIIGVAVGGMVVMMITPIYNLVGGIEGQF